MICPQCGYDMGNRNRCLRCGHEVKTLVTVDEKEQEQETRKEENETKVIDPSNTYISSGGMFEEVDPIAAMFDDLFNPFGDILSMLGLNVRTSFGGSIFGNPFGSFEWRGTSETPREDAPKKRKKQGPIVEVDNVEFLDADGNPIDDKKKRDDKK